MRQAAALLAALFVPLLGAQIALAADPVEWLDRANQSARQLDYSGTYVYQHGGHVEVLRVSHRVDGKLEREKVEVLEGGAYREFIRVNDEVYCHLADGKTVRVDKSAVQRFFPSVLPNEPVRLAENYIPKLGGGDRVAGRDCQIVILEPRDEFRHTHMIWMDRATSLPLKLQVVDSRGARVAMFVFSEVEIGKRPDRALFDVRMAGKRTQAASFMAGVQDIVWSVNPPPGYVRILESMRPLPGVKIPVLHSVYSDGMSNLSLFIEPVLNGDAGLEGLSTEGTINIYGRRIGDHKVTAVGDVPPSALLQVVNSVRRK